MAMLDLRRHAALSLCRFVAAVAIGARPADAHRIAVRDVPSTE